MHILQWMSLIPSYGWVNPATYNANWFPPGSNLVCGMPEPYHAARAARTTPPHQKSMERKQLHDIVFVDGR